MIQIDHKELKQVIKRAFQTKTPLFTHGAVGIGKSQVIKETSQELAKELNKDFLENKANGKKNFCFIDRRLSQLEPSDLLGLPNFDMEKQVTKWISPDWLPQDKDSSGILFLDEMNLAMPSIQHAAYQLILDRKIGSYELPENWLVVAAGNRIEDYGGIFELSPALANRFIHVELSIPGIKLWSTWAFKNEINPDIISYLNWKPNRLYSFDKKQKTMSFSSPRMWEMCSKLISGLNSIREQEILISSAVGEAIALEFITFLKLKNKLDIDKLLKNPEEIKKITEIDQKYALLGALIERYKRDQKILGSCLDIVRNLEAEFSILLLRYLLNTFKSIDKSEDYIYKFTQELNKHKSYDLINTYSKYFID